MRHEAALIVAAACLLAAAANADEVPAVRNKPNRDPQLHFIDGPAVADAPALRTWLRKHEGGQRQLRLPVRLRNPGREGHVGAAAIALDDSALGVALADRVRTACGAAAECALWLEGYWSGTQLDLRRVGDVVVGASPRVGVQADERRGKAVQAKAAAAVQTDAGEVIYLEGLSAWPDDVAGREVEVFGVLASRKLIPDPEVDASGAVSAGAIGAQIVLESPRWSVVD